MARSSHSRSARSFRCCLTCSSLRRDLLSSRLWARPVRFWQRRELFGIRQGKKGTPTVCAGGPVRRLDLHALRTAAGFHAGIRWQMWQQAVKGTRDARPWHEFEALHLADPAKMSLAQAKQNFLGQARINAMRIFKL